MTIRNWLTYSRKSDWMSSDIHQHTECTRASFSPNPKHMSDSYVDMLVNHTHTHALLVSRCFKSNKIKFISSKPKYNITKT